MTTSIPYSTVINRVNMALDVMSALAIPGGDSVYLGIGRQYPWLVNDTFIPAPTESTDALNQLHRDLCAIKQLSIGDASLVVERNDWVGNTFVYTPYSNTVDMFSTVSYTNSNGTVSVANSNILIGNNTTFVLDFSNNDFILLQGDGITVMPQIKEIIAITSNTSMLVNSAFTNTYVANVAQFVNNTYPSYAANFYVRNSYDQVFVCLDNNSGVVSNSMPAISLGGQLPTNPYIVTADGYQWKYLYTMSSGQKQLFLTSQYMPVTVDPNVLAAAADGRIDVVNIVNQGSGYNGNVANFSAPILTVVGDGSGANLTAQVSSNGNITGINVVNGGASYTEATIIANTGANGTGAIINAVIGPRGGWGANSAYQLGATTLMISTGLDDTEANTIPTVDSQNEYFSYRQLSIILNPILAANANIANSLNYDMTTVIQVSANPGFKMNDYAYQNFNTGILANASFSGRVVWFDNTTNNLHLNNCQGTFVPQSPLYGVSSELAGQNNSPYVTVTAFSLTEPPIETFSGRDLFIENISPIVRYPNQTEEIRLIVSF